MSVSKKTAGPTDVCVSVITVLHDSEDAFSRSAPALTAELSRIQPRYTSEALYIDNASDSDPTDVVRSFLPSARVIRLAKNTGFAAACNLGAHQASGQYLFFLNPDVILDAGAIEELIEALDSHSDAWAVTGRMRNPDGSFQPTCRKLPTKTNIFGSRGSALAKILGSRDTDDSFSYTLPDFPELTQVPATAATALMMRRETFDKLGGFDERFFMYLEDTDLCAEIHERGGRIYFCPQAGAVHYWGEGSRASMFNRLRWHHQSVWRYYRKRLPGFFSAIVLPFALLTNFVISTCVSALRGR